jgi:hypothetical protein
VLLVRDESNTVVLWEWVCFIYCYLREKQAKGNSAFGHTSGSAQLQNQRKLAWLSLANPYDVV